MTSVEYDYDLIVIGGGSGGIVAAKEAANLGARVALFDYVEKSPHGTSWGLGGTCVNVGCIPKKLMHQAGLIGEGFSQVERYGWQQKGKPTHDWSTLVNNVTEHISGLNWGYKSNLRQYNVNYINALAKFSDPHTITYTQKVGIFEKENTVTAKKFIIAIGGRPNYPEIPGVELGISSDDIFRLDKPPGKTLVVGASYVALECAGFLGGLGYQTDVMIRSIPLRGFDQSMAEKVVNYMEQEKICGFIRGATPSKLEKTDDGKIEVTYNIKTRETETLSKTEVYDTVLFAIGRRVDTESLNLPELKTRSDGKIPVYHNYQTNLTHVYAIGDVVTVSLELTTTAIMEGRKLANYLFRDDGNIPKLPLYTPSAVFTPLEYGFVGLSSEAAEEKYGVDACETYHTHFTPLEWKLTNHEANTCYCKIVVVKETDAVVGLHILAPNAGEIVSGFSVAINMGLTRCTLINNLGIHPTITEELFKLDITVSSGISATDPGC